jgi:hypothetical protein
VINSNVVEDLDSLYFFDKIEMRANSTSHKVVPKLDLQFIEMFKAQQKKAEAKKIISVKFL